MSKKYLLILSLAFALGLASVTHAEDTATTNTPTAVKAEVRTNAGVRADIKATYDAQKKALEEQRKKMMQEAEAMRAKAKAAGDEFKAKQEAMKLELETRRAEADAKREALKKEAENKRAELKANLEMRKASSTERRVEFQKEAAKRKVDNVAKVTNATIERLEQIIARIESRIAKLKAAGHDTAEAERLVTASKEALVEARAVVEGFANLDLTSEKAQENFEQIRTAAGDARELIRTARENLILAVRALSKYDEVRATSTVEVN